MSDTGEQPQDRERTEDLPEIEDLEISKEEADAVSGGAVSSTAPAGTRHGA